ncbi:hypothetical protein [Acinetobacter sp. ANC 3813]|uniref:hypothetical protein n=1 Tax=Acinetobacter sp. ANC 3813 TaxID=1977873 RepID=UPI000A33BBE2|nr:hypothetical protein [Acinetobacter sp. ANC 3813]OTG91402.1 hypothetical protein B9T34_03590 [Acinetobacter sp. ANC 3813]
MIKIIISAFLTIFALLCSCIIYFWRDTSYQPTGWDLLNYLLLLPVLVTAIVFSPYLILTIIKYFRKKKDLKQQQSAEIAQQNILSENLFKAPDVSIRQFSLNIFSAAAVHSFGENSEILEEYKKFRSPELDSDLCNAYGLPLLSFRIRALDQLLADSDDENSSLRSIREQRILQLIQHQLEPHAEALFAAAQHLKDSAMFYDSEMAYQYRMHPAWRGESYEEPDTLQEVNSRVIARLNQLFVYLLLPEDLIHQHNDQARAELLSSLAAQYSILEAQIEMEYHFISQHSAYTEWLKLLEQVAQQKYCFNLIIAVDSEIDQECLDEKFWQSEQYIAAEYAASWCVAPIDTLIEDLNPKRTLKISVNESCAGHFIEQNKLNEYEQFQQDEPCVLFLDDMQNIKSSKKLHQKFSETFIETQHFLYTYHNTGHTQQLAKVFHFMVGMHLSEELKGLIFSADREDVYAVFDDYQAAADLDVQQNGERAYLEQ